MHRVMLQDAGPKTHAMTRPINTPDEISRIYDFVAYPKAASVIRMIEHIMTPEKFRKALNLYIDERWNFLCLRLFRWVRKLFRKNFFRRSSFICRSYKTATDEQLFKVLEKVRREASETYYPPIPEIFRTWANNPGYPILNVEFFSSNRTVKVSQELFVPFINSSAPSEFHILYNYAASSNGVDAFSTTLPTNWIHKEPEIRHALDNTEDNERWVIFNVQQTGKRSFCKHKKKSFEVIFSCFWSLKNWKIMLVIIIFA